MTQHGTLGVVREIDVPVTMRDGTVLRANVFRPDSSDSFPGLLMRTPYKKPESGFERFARAGYAVVAQDSRGRYASDGEFKVFAEKNTKDDEDGYDSVEWLAEQPYCNGRVGTFGRSYNSWMQWKLAKLRPPHLIAMCADSVPTEIIPLDFPGGFRPGRRVHWLLCNMAPDIRKRLGLKPPHTPAEAGKYWLDVEQGSKLSLLPWSELIEYLPPGLKETISEWFKHPFRPVWCFSENYCDIEVPNLDFSGWYDHCNDTINHFSGMQKDGKTEIARTQSKIILGPWTHCSVGQRKTEGAEIDFGPDAAVDIGDIQIRWFDYWLKELDNGVDKQPPVQYFVMGSDKWKSASSWPPADTCPSVYYFTSDGNAGQAQGDGALIPTEPDNPGEDQYTYNPRNPVPTLWTPQLFTIPSNRRQLETRDDILYYRTPPLKEEIEIAGEPEVILYASSSAPDTDFFARLVDEYPEGQGPALEICYGMVRARYRHSYDKDELLVPGEITEFRIKLGPTACRFQKGHIIRLEITSSDFPNHDRNHNIGRNDLFDAELACAEQRIVHSKEYPSQLILPVN